MDKLEKRILLGLSAVVLVLLAAVLIQRGGERETVAGEFTPPPFDAAAVSGQPENVDVAIYGTLALNGEVTVSLYSAPIVQDGAAQVYFTAAADNAAWVRLRLLDTEGELLGESGLLRPGEYVEFVALETEPDSSAAIAKILTYEPDTYYSMGTATAQVMLQLANE